MSDGTIGVYYFNGEDGCDICDGMTGYYEDLISPPHENCDCVQEMIWLDIDSPEVSIEYRNIDKDYGDSFEGCYYTNGAENHSTKVALNRSFDIDVSVESFIDIPSELEDLVSYDDETLEINESLDMTIEPGDSVSIAVMVTVDTHIYRAEKWIVFENFETKVADFEGYVQKPSNYVIEVY